MSREARLLVGGLVFPECPRWREGKLWFSDMHGLKVMRADLSGRTETIAEVTGQPAGLGWLPNGGLLVVSQTDRRLLRLGRNGLFEVADLSKLAPVSCNDMVVDNQGRAYIGHFGSHTSVQPSTWSPAHIILVTPDGGVRVAADNLSFPNGMVITADGRTLIVAETFGHRLTAFAIQPDGSLTGQRVWAPLENVAPDGICLDAEGAIWAATVANEIVRVKEGGEIVDRVITSTKAFACMLGGVDRRTLFVCAADSFDAQEVRLKRNGRIEVAQVDVPGAGLP